MIISASRRTDVPAYYSEWFINRVQAGFVYVRNPMNHHQVSRICLSPDVVDGIVFWTKNPLPMLGRLDELRDYMYYFQFSVTPYGEDVEPGIPSKREAILPAFKRLSDLIGADTVIWRYDPILINEKYSVDYHVRAFSKIAGELCGKTHRVTISFIDEDYRGVKSNVRELALSAFTEEMQVELSARLADIAHSHGLVIDTCAESLDLSQYGIGHARCINGELLSKLVGCPLVVVKDKTQRPECGCVTSIDIGAYNTCKSGCRYCYANYSANSVDGNYAGHDPTSPLISGGIGEHDRISERDARSCRDMQLRIDGAYSV